jgi:hypothetical protein
MTHTIVHEPGTLTFAQPGINQSIYCDGFDGT